VNVWKTITVEQSKLVDHGPPLTKPELHIGDVVYVQTLLGLRRMKVALMHMEMQPGREPPPPLALVDDGCIGFLELDPEGHWFCGTMINRNSLKQVDLSAVQIDGSICDHVGPQGRPK